MLALAARALLLFVAIEHVGFMVLEMFLWTTPRGMKIFGRTAEQARDSAALAMNQGLYNGFLAAGLVWAAFAQREPFALRMFFLGCVVVAGIFGGLTAKRSILFVQALPALIAVAVCYADNASRAQ